MKAIKLKGLDEEIYYDVCKNGLPIYVWPNNKVSSFYATLSVRYGSIYNNFSVNGKKYNTNKGCAHFLEHIKFNEGPNRTAHDYYNEHTCDTNAFTTFDYTNYQVFGSSDPLNNISHLVEFVTNPYFTKQMVEKEKGIIVSESCMGNDDPYTVMLFKTIENTFHNYEYKYSITGEKEDIEKINLEELELIYNTFYNPKNMFLIITGNVNPYEIIPFIKDKNNISCESVNYKRIIPKEKNSVVKKYEECELNVTDKKIRVAIKTNIKAFKGLSNFEIRLYSNILFNANIGETSDFKDMLLQKGIVSSLYFMNEIFDNYLFSVISVEGEDEELILKLLEEKLSSLDIEKDTFERMKKAIISSLILTNEHVQSANYHLQNDILNYNGVTDDIKEKYENANYKKINKVIKNIDVDNKSILVFKPIKK